MNDFKKGDIAICLVDKIYYKYLIFKSGKFYNIQYITDDFIGIKSKSGRTYKFRRKLSDINHNYPDINTYFKKLDKFYTRKYKLNKYLNG